MSVNLGKLFIDDVTYRNAEGLANSDAVMFASNPSDYKWSKEVTRSKADSKTADIGTALHCAILEPERFNSLVVECDLKSRTTKGFLELQKDNSDKIVLLSSELEQIKLMCDSIKCHPTASSLIELDGDCESSVFVKDKSTGVLLKCRPDKDAVLSSGIVIDLKTTADLKDWRSDKEWSNPLYKFNYGHQASYYIDILEQFHQKEIDSFVFIVIQKTMVFGKHPVGVFQITKDELIDLGFWSSHRSNISEYKRCSDNSDWFHTESFPFYPDDIDGDIVVTFDGDINA